MGIRKQFLKSRPTCKVTFNIPEDISKSAQEAHVVGEFNEWSISATPMRRLKNGAFSATVELPTGRAYQFRYLLEKSQWINDPDADEYHVTPFGDSQNSVILL